MIGLLRRGIPVLFVLVVGCAGSGKTEYNNGNSRLKNGEYKEAIAEFDKAININPRFKEAYYNRGLAKWGLTDFEGAIADFDKAIEIDPMYTKAKEQREKVALGIQHKPTISSIQSEMDEHQQRVRQELDRREKEEPPPTTSDLATAE